MGRAMADKLLEVSNLSTGYGDVQVLWDVGFDITRGETVCLVGSNGAGKSTLLRCLSGLIPATAGGFRFEGREMTGRSPQDIVGAGIAHVPEGRRLFGPMSVHDNLLLGAYLRRDKDSVQRDLDRVLSLFPILAQRRNQAAGTLSGGEQQMCAIARGMMNNPKLLMIDELSLGLAPQVVEMLSETIRTISKDGLSVLLVEQDAITAFELATRGIVLDSGRVRLIDATAKLAENPAVQEAYMGLA
jgi:branched-chain amino acid transport system ATP-binding protein